MALVASVLLFRPGDWLFDAQVVSISPMNPIASSSQAIVVTSSNFLMGLRIDVFRNGAMLSHLSGSLVMVDSATSVSLSFDFGSQAGAYGMELVNPGGQRSQRLLSGCSPRVWVQRSLLLRRQAPSPG